MATAFGGVLPGALRARLGLPLRQFCMENGYDAGNISKLERGLLVPPRREAKLRDYASALPDQEGVRGLDHLFRSGCRVTARDPQMTSWRTSDSSADSRWCSALLRGQKVDERQLGRLVERMPEGVGHERPRSPAVLRGRPRERGRFSRRPSPLSSHASSCRGHRRVPPRHQHHPPIGLHADFGTDGFLSADMTEISVDLAVFKVVPHAIASPWLTSSGISSFTAST